METAGGLNVLTAIKLTLLTLPKQELANLKTNLKHKTPSLFSENFINQQLQSTFC
jgi:hypothetical protein